MKKLAIILAALIALSSFAAVSAESAGKTVQFLYVSPDGSDEASGTKAAPFKTIEQAVFAAREIDSTVVVNLRGGKYNISEPIKLTAADKNLVIRGLPGENAVITAGHTIPYSAFKTVTDASFLNKLSDSSAKGKIMSVNLNFAIKHHLTLMEIGFFYAISPSMERNSALPLGVTSVYTP